MEIVILGHMGRDEAVAERLEGHKLHILGQLPNPGLIEKAKASGGRFQIIDSIIDTKTVVDYVQAVEPDMFLTNFDDALAAGVVDAIKQRVREKRTPDLLLPCPDKAASRVEWDKFYLRELIEEIEPSYNPANFMAKTEIEASRAIDFFALAGKEIVLKPRNLTGGKGVKVQGKHFAAHREGLGYAKQVLASPDQSGIEVQEKVEGFEFTLQLFTDGRTITKPPTTYDYPYREDGDTGPGTGGMGTFTMQAGEILPFLDQRDYEEAVTLMNRLLNALEERGIEYKGILYPTFFKTTDGLKIVEVNARGGDPELINILDLMQDDIDLSEVLEQIATGELDRDSIRFKEMASAVIYLVSPDYGYRQGQDYNFNMYLDRIKDLDCKVRFAAAARIFDNYYSSWGSSRTVGLSALGRTPWEARSKIHLAIQEGFNPSHKLEFRKEIADEEYIKNLNIT
jgi:phosphoribosylamine--glycine ligase